MANEAYWNIRAVDLKSSYGDSTDGFDEILNAIALTKAEIILDFGCGSGRCFKIYEEAKVTYFGLDLSKVALQLSGKDDRFVIHGDYKQLEKFSDKYFSLVVSYRVLSAVEPKDIIDCVSEIKRVSKYTFIREYNGSIVSDYWYSHDYDSMFSNPIYVNGEIKIYKNG
jgi:ubiquinone/menaquinone biosynthesis C-methylase UbiE